MDYRNPEAEATTRRRVDLLAGLYEAQEAEVAVRAPTLPRACTCTFSRAVPHGTRQQPLAPCTCSSSCAAARPRVQGSVSVDEAAQRDMAEVDRDLQASTAQCDM